MSQQTAFIVLVDDGDIERVFLDRVLADQFMAVAKDVLHCWIEERPIETAVPHPVKWWNVRWGGSLGDSFNEPTSFTMMSDRVTWPDPSVSEFGSGTGLSAMAADRERAVAALMEAVATRKAGGSTP